MILKPLPNGWFNSLKSKGIIQRCILPPSPGFIGPCNCRKPNLSMILQTRGEFDIDLANSVLIDDKESDIEAAGVQALESLFY